MHTIPKIISVDDHIIEPPTLWTERLPAKYRDAGPRVERVRKSEMKSIALAPGAEERAVRDGVDGWVDRWVYADLTWPLIAGYASIGDLRLVSALDPITYDDMRPGCYQQAPRLEDMDANHTDASLCFPSFSRFCGQTFYERQDKDLALLCVKAYNDWMIDEWCAGVGSGRLIPLTLIPLWDADLAADEVRRCADKGSHAVAFSECPPYLGLPSIHSGAWEPFFRACEETETVINMHIGSSSKLPSTSADAPLVVTIALTAQNAQNALVDWLTSGALVRHKTLKIALSEGQVGWMPFLLERLDSAWERSESYEPELLERIPNRPSSYVPGRVYGCIFDDMSGLQIRDKIGMGQIMFETDYPHADSTYPHSLQTADKLITGAGLSEHEAWQFMRGNAIECYGLQRWGITN